MIVVGVFTVSESKAQGEQHMIKLSGVVVEGDSLFGVPGVHIVVENAGKGTVSNQAGLFSADVFPGDSISFSAVGFKKVKMAVPDTRNPAWTVVVKLQEDVKTLPQIEIYPYPTKELFREAFLALDQEEDPRITNMKENVNQEKITYMAKVIEDDYNDNFNTFLKQQQAMQTARMFAPSFSFTDPFAWARFIKSVQNGDLKKKRWN
ncbi:carboxypeptidase-like protein [Sediminitomix flava]|uniref:Carboxypeptidase-like protein n=2 Tax=Sediminitomix flava TaxID=379075 RepID=A0A315Z146_SEDFL|nr:carboxypeptidase-like protein [Sediminitomix flava]